MTRLDKDSILKDVDTTKFTSDFLAAYLQNGLGSMTKRQIDVLVMHLLEAHAALEFRSNHELSIAFHLSEGRVKGLRYEAALHYGDDAESSLQRRLLFAIARSQLSERDGRIEFVLEDNLARQVLDGRLKQRGSYSDRSFNSEIVRVDRSALGDILVDVYGQEVAGPFIDDLKKASKQAQFRKIRAKLVEGCAKAVPGLTIQAAKAWIVPGL